VIIDDNDTATPDDKNSVPPESHKNFVVAMFLAWLAVISVLCFLQSASNDTKALIVGVAVNCNLVFFYGAPLSTITSVLRSRNSASIHIPTMVTNTANGTFWAAYGWTVWDLFVAIPNLLGALLGVIQILLVLVFPRETMLEATSSNGGSSSMVKIPEHSTPSREQEEDNMCKEIEEGGFTAEVDIPDGDNPKRRCSRSSSTEDVRHVIDLMTGELKQVNQ